MISRLREKQDDPHDRFVYEMSRLAEYPDDPCIVGSSLAAPLTSDLPCPANQCVPVSFCGLKTGKRQRNGVSPPFPLVNLWWRMRCLEFEVCLGFDGAMRGDLIVSLERRGLGLHGPL